MMLINKAVETIKKHKMIAPGEHIIVAVSGGADSVALLNVLMVLKQKWRLDLTVAHLDHGIRGAESRREAEFVRGLACQMDIPCISEQRDVLSCKKEKGLSLQEAAREVRYLFFQEVFMREHADKIALGHHADDQAETILMWFLKGASINGLSGMPPLRDGIFIRPLIEVTRNEIEQYLQQSSIDSIPDTSQYELHYLRNKIRHQLIPILKKEYNPRIVETLTRMADLLRPDKEMLDKQAGDAVNKCLFKKGDKIYCNIDDIRKYSPSILGRLIKNIFYDLEGPTKGLAFKHIDAVRHLLDGKGPSRVVQMPGGLCVRREYGRLVFKKGDLDKFSYSFSFDNLPDSVRIDKIGREIYFRFVDINNKKDIFKDKEKDVELLNFKEVKFPLVIRNWLPGDRFYPLGLGGSKKLKDLFIDRKVSVCEREKVPVMLFQDRIAWVCGFRIDERFKLKPDSKQALKVWIE